MRLQVLVAELLFFIIFRRLGWSKIDIKIWINPVQLVLSTLKAWDCPRARRTIPATKTGIEAISIPSIGLSLLGRVGMGALPRAAGSDLLFKEIALLTMGIEYANPAIAAATKIAPITIFLDVII